MLIPYIYTLYRTQVKVIIDGAKLRRFHELFGTILKKSFMECVDAFFALAEKSASRLAFSPAYLYL